MSTAVKPAGRGKSPQTEEAGRRRLARELLTDPDAHGVVVEMFSAAARDLPVLAENDNADELRGRLAALLLLTEAVGALRREVADG